MSETTAVLDYYTAYYTDSIQKEQEGIAFAAVRVSNDEKTKIIASHDGNETYMTMWLKSVANILEELDARITQKLDSEYTMLVNIWVGHPNIIAIGKKLTSIIKDCQNYDQDMSRIVELKLKKRNGTKYNHHDYQKRIVMAMLSLDKKLKLHFRIKQGNPRQSEMGIAYQAAKDALLQRQSEPTQEQLQS